MEIEWDTLKAQANQLKHGVRFNEAVTVFGDPLELTVLDPDHSIGEYRFLSIGRTTAGRLLVISYAEKTENRIRLISARPATKTERKHYESLH